MPATCADCGGDGYYDDNSLCLTCFGNGATPAKGRETAMVKLLVEIKAEQASQREDLTAALTQIWNKVKDL